MIHFEGRVAGFDFEFLGLIPFMLSEADPRSAQQQLDDHYQHGGGWSDFAGFRMLANGNMLFPGDPPVRLIAEAKLRHETIRVYEMSWVAIVQPDGSFAVSRMD